MQIEGYEPEFQTDQAIEYCRDHADEPFCLYVSWGPPHNPYEHVPDRYKEMYPPEEIQLRPECCRYTRNPKGHLWLLRAYHGFG